MFDVFGVDWRFWKRLVFPSIGLKPEGLKVVLMLGLSVVRGSENRLLPGELITEGNLEKEWKPVVFIELEASVVIELGGPKSAFCSASSAVLDVLERGVLRMEFPRSKGRFVASLDATDGVG